MTRRTKQTFFRIIFLTALAFIAYVLVALNFSFFPFNKKVQNPETNLGSNKIDSSLIDNEVEQDNPAPEPPQKTPIQNDGEDPNDSEIITGYVSNKSFTSEYLVIRVVISQFLTESGSCVLRLTNGTKTVTETANTFNNPSSSTCQGFDILLDKLDSGKWDLSIQVKTVSKIGTISGGEVVVP